MKLDLSLYLVTDRFLCGGKDIADVVRMAAEGGVTCVQLREKDCSTKDFLDSALKLKALLTPFHIPLIINDRVDIALASNADGVHIGQNDMPPKIARELMGKNKVIGLSVENIEQVEEANDLDVDYIGVSPIFLTQTKWDIKEPFGIEGTIAAVKISRHPIVAIGGIGKENAAQVIHTGAQGIAVVSAIVAADDPKREACQLAITVKQAKQKR